MSFEEFGFGPVLLAAVQRKGFAAPTQIQVEAIPEALAGRDLMGCAQTGTGKTVAFLLPAIERLSQEKHARPGARFVILAPTRELVLQIADEARALTSGLDLPVSAVFGGGSNSQTS